ncbi:hypothetical protein Y032_0439g1491 [Ancylostoma ceylanicum]|uniref:Uncharacterized protein n=1 Tax=Ancylostoma ceylanicum TaxID=53326 RepID=A0A016X1H1_9BILA|nr:hypothetical protein Y032_0439g1491 [Ancylostoma ceylanicum]
MKTESTCKVMVIIVIIVRNNPSAQTCGRFCEIPYLLYTFSFTNLATGKAFKMRYPFCSVREGGEPKPVHWLWRMVSERRGSAMRKGRAERRPSRY